MTPSDLRAAGEALFGQQWQSPLARDLGVSDRSMRRWVAGTHPIPDRLQGEVAKLIQKRIRTLEKLVA